MPNNNLLILDFCNTCVDFETADEFVFFVMREKKEEKKLLKAQKKVKFFNRTRISRIYYWLTKKSLSKKIYANLLKGYNEMEINHLGKLYYEEKLKPHFISPTFNILNSYQRSGYMVCLLSGAYLNYLQYFAKDYDIDIVIPTILGVKNGHMSGKISEDRMGERKVKALLETVKLSHFQNIVCVSDGKSDIPVFKLAQKQIVIAKSHRDWLDQLDNPEEIIYEPKK